MKAEGIEYDERMERLEEVTWPKPLDELLEAGYEMYRQTHPWIAEYPLSPKSVRPGDGRAGQTFDEFVVRLRVGPLGGPGAALPVRRLQGAAPDGPGGRRRPERRRRPDRVARRADPADRLQPARRVGGPGAGTGVVPTTRRPNPRRPRRSPRTPAPSPCWCATRCSAACCCSPCTAGPSSVSSTPSRLGRGPWAEAAPAYYANTTWSTPAGCPSAALFLIEEHPGYWEVQPDHRQPRGQPRLAHHRLRRPFAASDEAGDLVLELASFKPL